MTGPFRPRLNWHTTLVLIGGLASASTTRSATPPVDGTFRDVGDGLAWRRDRVKSVPLVYSVVRFDRSRSDLKLIPTLAQGRRIGLGTLTQQLEQLPPDAGKPVAAINGDFYSTEDEPFPGDPRGLFISGTELVSAPVNRDCFWLDASGQPHVGGVKSQFILKWPDGRQLPFGLNESATENQAVLYTAAVDPASHPSGTIPVVLEKPDGVPAAAFQIGESYRIRPTSRPRSKGPGTAAIHLPTEWSTQFRRIPTNTPVEIITRTTPDLKGSPAAIGGGPALVRNGAALNPRAVKSNERHPRSALGWNRQYFFLAVVDGRQPDWSIGVTLSDLAVYMAGLGCDEAMNLDGGGSSELWLNGRILNRPCYGHERPTATTLAVVRQPAADGPAPNPVTGSPAPRP